MEMHMMMRVLVAMIVAFACVAFGVANNSIQMNYPVNVSFVFQSIQNTIYGDTIAHSFSLLLNFSLRQRPAGF
jgi:hypothetical protein